MVKGYKYYNPLTPTSGKIQLLSLGLASPSYCFCLQPLEVSYNYYYAWRSYNREGTQYCACIVRMQHTVQHIRMMHLQQRLMRYWIEAVWQGKKDTPLLVVWLSLLWEDMQYYNNAQSDVNDTSVIVEWLSHCVYSRVHKPTIFCCSIVPIIICRDAAITRVAFL